MGVKPVRLEVNAPVPTPSLDLVVSAIVGFGLVDQITPRSVTAEPPSLLTLPPLLVVVVVMALTTPVNTEGIEIDCPVVLNDNSLPYPVPTLFVA